MSRRAALLTAMLVACAKRGPRDVGDTHPRSEFAEGPDGLPRPDSGTASTPDASASTSEPFRELARASSRAIALDAAYVYFGDAEDDGLYAVAKSGGAPTKLARRAPMPATLVIDGPNAIWVGTPGDVVLRTPTPAPPNAASAPPSPPPPAAASLRDRGLFTGIAAASHDLFVIEADGPSAVVTRLAGSAGASAPAQRVATFDGSPRSAVGDSDHVFVATSTRLGAVGRARGDSSPVTLASGTSFASPVVDDIWVYAVVPTPRGRTRDVVRVRKTGGALETVVTGARDAPIAIDQGTLYWFDADKPALLRRGPRDNRPRTVAEDDRLAQPAALAIDRDGVFIAAGFAEEGRILALPAQPQTP